MPKIEPPRDFPTPADQRFCDDFLAKPQPEEWRVPPYRRIPCEECGQFMAYRRGNWHFEGDYAVNTYRLECQHGCAVSAEIVYREFAPKGSA